jgi:hypothetical protein
MKYLILSFLLLTLPLCAADFSGKWSGSYDALMQDGQAMKGQITLTLEQNGAEISGTAGGDHGDMKISKGKADGDNVTFEIQTEGPKIVFTLKLVEEHLRGEGNGDTEGVKVKLDLTRG